MDIPRKNRRTRLRSFVPDRAPLLPHLRWRWKLEMVVLAVGVALQGRKH